MVDQNIVNTFAPITDAIKGGVPGVGGFSTGWLVGIGLFVGLAIFSIIGAFIYWFFWSKKQWNIVTRVHYENPTIRGITIGSPVPTKRVRFKDGRVVYLYKIPIQGYTISPELLTWTRPREHDVIVTQDKKVFCIVGIESIDVQRKKLNVDVSYPDIEMDRQDLQQHIDSKKFDDPNERFKILAKVALWIFVIVGVIVLVIVGGKTYIDGKNIDLQRDNMNLQVSANQAKVMESVNTFLLILKSTMPESFKNIDGKNLLLNVTSTTTP
jgi:hypothetical protein